MAFVSAGFTPGPWTREEDDEYSIILSGPDGVCLMEGHTVGPYNPELREANARLIAAAPELYDALIEAKRSLWEDARHSWNLVDFKNFAVVQQIDAALAKARTEQVAA